MTAVQPVGNPTGMVDKWQALEALTEAAGSYGVSHRTLGVLRALLTFLPGRLIDPDPSAAIVFPSNRTLGRRLNGMPESTLRRHIAALVARGIVSRRNSPNGKRFARRTGQGDGIAFGIDLSPLARWIGDLLREAEAAREEARAIAVLRARVGALRADVLDADGPSPLTEEARRALRRKPDAATLTALIDALEARIVSRTAREMSGSDARNERHIQSEFRFSSDSEGARTIDGITRDEAQVAENRSNVASVPPEDETQGTLSRVLKTCQEFRCYFPEPVRNWRDLVVIADRLAPMVGIDPPVFREAGQVMGLQRAATAVLCIVEDLGRIRSPGAYLRELTRKARTGGFSERPLLDALSHRRIVS